MTGGLGAAPQTPLGEHTALPDLLAGFKGPTSKGREGRKNGGRATRRKGERRIGKRRGKEGRERGERKEGEGRGLPSVPPLPNLHYTTVVEVH